MIEKQRKIERRKEHFKKKKEDPFHEISLICLSL